jgi:four helix bundle protein
MRDSSRSVKQNIVEGWKRETTQQYIDFLSYSFGSLAELKEDGQDCFKLKLITQREFDELMKRCGELDFLMGRLKEALGRKISKEETLSPYERWLEKETERKIENEKKVDKELRETLRKEGKIFTIEGVMSVEEAEKRGLKEIEIP